MWRSPIVILALLVFSLLTLSSNVYASTSDGLELTSSVAIYLADNNTYVFLEQNLTLGNLVINDTGVYFQQVNLPTATLSFGLSANNSNVTILEVTNTYIKLETDAPTSTWDNLALYLNNMPGRVVVVDGSTSGVLADIYSSKYFHDRGSWEQYDKPGAYYNNGVLMLKGQHHSPLIYTIYLPPTSQPTGGGGGGGGGAPVANQPTEIPKITPPTGLDARAIAGLLIIVGAVLFSGLLGSYKARRGRLHDKWVKRLERELGKEVKWKRKKKWWE